MKCMHFCLRRRKSITVYYSMWVLVCSVVCVLQRHVTLSGCAGVTLPPRSNTGVHIEDGTRHTAESVCERCWQPVIPMCCAAPLDCSSPALNLIGEATVMLPLLLLMFRRDSNSLVQTLMVRPDLFWPFGESKTESPLCFLDTFVATSLLRKFNSLFDSIFIINLTEAV